MRIIDKSLEGERDFESLELEDVFRFGGRLFMKVAESYSGALNAYDFSKSRLCGISPDTKVHYVSTELVLHEDGWELDN